MMSKRLCKSLDEYFVTKRRRVEEENEDDIVTDDSNVNSNKSTVGDTDSA